ncbi:hypothetical protein LCGC14_2263390, partial [marine sediment metagenome]
VGGYVVLVLVVVLCCEFYKTRLRKGTAPTEGEIDG